MVLKASMLMRASADPESLTVTPKDLENAIKYVEVSHSKAEKYLSEEVATDRYEQQRLKLLEVVDRNQGRVQWSKALVNSHLSARDFKEAVETLKQSDRLVIDAGPGNGYLCIPGYELPTRKNGTH
jgi:hypothetical protein